MGVRQDKERVSKLHVLNQLYGGLTTEQKIEYGESFEQAAAKVMGEVWEEAGYSIESSGVQIEWYMRGVMSSTSPIVVDSPRLMKNLTRRFVGGDQGQASFESNSLLGAFYTPPPQRLTPNQELTLNRLGFGEESFEVVGGLLFVGAAAGVAGAIKLSDWISKKREEKRQAVKAKQEADKPVNPEDITWDDVSRVPAFLNKNLSDSVIDGLTETEGKISGDGVVKRLTWGHQFDENDPVGFLTKMLAQYDAFYRKYEAAVSEVDDFVQKDEKTTRPAVMAVKDDEAKIVEVIDKATAALKAEFEKAHAVLLSTKVVFPNARTFDPDSVKKGLSRSIPDTAFKPIAQIRPLTKEEAKKMVHLLAKAISEMKKYTTIFNRKWSDHSDGDDFWDVIDATHADSDGYAGYIYYQSADNDLVSYVDDISEILAAVSMGVLAWIERSFKSSKA